MSQKISLKEAERKAFTSAYQDGLWDIFLGCFVLQYAIAPFLSRSLGDFLSSAVFLPFLGLLFLAIWLIRKYVVTPRVGIVKLGSWRKARLLRFNLVVFAVLILAFILGMLSAVSFAVMPSWIPAVSFSLIILIAFSVAAYFLNFSRLYIYGILLALSPLVGEWLYRVFRVPHHGFPITFGLIAVTIILIGLVKFIRFLHDHPLPAEDSASQGA